MGGPVAVSEILYRHIEAFKEDELLSKAHYRRHASPRPKATIQVAGRRRRLRCVTRLMVEEQSTAVPIEGIHG
jgi:hypothetical protein